MDIGCNVGVNVYDHIQCESKAATTSFAVFSLCLTLFPRFLLFLAQESGGRGKLTSLEEYLALQLGILLGTVSLAAISMVGSFSLLAVKTTRLS